MCSFTEELGKNIMDVATNDDSSQELEELCGSSEEKSVNLEDDDTSCEPVSESSTESSDIHNEPHQPIMENKNSQNISQIPQVVNPTQEQIPNSPILNKTVQTAVQHQILKETVKPLQKTPPTGNIQKPNIAKAKCNVECSSRGTPELTNSVQQQLLRRTPPTITQISSSIKGSQEKMQDVKNNLLDVKGIIKIGDVETQNKKVRFDKSAVDKTQVSATQVSQLAQSTIQRATRSLNLPMSTIYLLIAFLGLGVTFYIFQKYVSSDKCRSDKNRCLVDENRHYPNDEQ
jgi:hypothetical protein